jgi:hypothetical protein
MAAREQAMEDALGDGKVEQGELLEERETHGRRDLIGEIDMADGDRKESGRGAE